MKKFSKSFNIILTGMPGAGKSTVGLMLSKTMKRSYIDTDRLIQSGERKSLREIISTSGMKYFLALEENYIMRLDAHSSIISTGGSVIYSSKAMEKLAASGIIIHLNLKLSEIKKRFSSMDERGVARDTGQSMEDLYKERLPLYQNHADLAIDCNKLSPEEIEKKILSSLKRYEKKRY